MVPVPYRFSIPVFLSPILTAKCRTLGVEFGCRCRIFTRAQCINTLRYLTMKDITSSAPVPLSLSQPSKQHNNTEIPLPNNQLISSSCRCQKSLSSVPVLEASPSPVSSSKTQFPAQSTRPNHPAITATKAAPWTYTLEPANLLLKKPASSQNSISILGPKEKQARSSSTMGVCSGTTMC